MMKKKRLSKLTAMLLAVIMLVGLLPVSALAAEETVDINIGKDGLPEGSYTTVIDTPITAGGDSAITIATTYLIDVETTSVIQFVNATGSAIRKNKYLSLSAVSSKSSWPKERAYSPTALPDETVTTTEVSAEQLKTAGFSENDFNPNCYTYYFLGILSTNYYGILVQVSVPEGADSIDKSELSELIASVTGENESNWYQENDRYNGDPEDTITDTDSGFWKEFTAENGPLIQAQTALDTAASTDAVNEAVSNLKKAIDELIPKKEINATELYEQIQKYTTGETGYYETDAERPTNQFSGNKLGHLLSDYSEYTANAFRTARDNAKNYLEGLYDADGNPTDENKAANQSKADGYASALKQAVMDLTEDFSISNIQTRLARLEIMFPYTENDSVRFTSESWTAYSSAKNAVYKFLEENPDSTQYVRSDVAEIRDLFEEYWYACHKLASSSETITVSFRAADNYGALNPEEAWSAADGLVSASLTVSNVATVKDVIETAELLGKIDNTSDAYAYYVYLNGVVLMNDDASEPLKLSDNNGFDWQDVTVRNGDELILLRAVMPKEEFFIHLVQAQFNTYASSFGTMRFKETSEVSVRASEAFTLSVERTGGYLNEYNGVYRAKSNAELIVYGPKQPDGSYPLSRSGVMTGADGSASLTLLKEGEYLVTTVDTRTEDMDAKSYPNLSAGCPPIKVTVAALSGEELDATIAAVEAEFTAYWEGVNKDVFSVEKLQLVTDYYTYGLEELREKDTLYDAITRKNELIDLIQAELDYATEFGDLQVEAFIRSLELFPDAEEIADRFTSAYIGRFEHLDGLYQAMSTYHKEQLNMMQINKYQALKEAYGEDGSALPAATRGVITVKAAEGEEEHLDSLFLSHRKEFILGYYVGTVSTSGELTVGYKKDYAESDPMPIDVQFPFNSEYSVLGDGYTYVNVQQRDMNLDTFKQITRIEVIGADDAEITIYTPETTWLTTIHESYDKVNGGESVNCNAAASIVIDSMPANDVTIILHFTEQTQTEAEKLLEAKETAKAELKAAVDGYNKTKYSAENWSALVAAYNDGVAEVNAAESETAVSSAVSAAKAAMAAVKTKAQEGDASLGKVKVIVENTTWEDAPSPFKGRFVEKELTLTENSTMMSLVLTALAEEGYGWSGTGGSGYGITYLSYVYQDTNGNNSYDKNTDPKLGEFDGANTSGWMGVLNDWFVNEGFPSFTAKASNRDYRIVDGDEIKVMFTLAGYGEDLGGTWGNADTSLKGLSVTGGTLSPAFSGSNTGYVLKLTDGKVSVTPEAANKNYLVKTFINEKNKANGTEYYRAGESLPVQAGDVICIGVGEPSWPSMNNQSSEAISYTGTWYEITVVDESSGSVVSELINGIGSVTYSNYRSKAADVTAARSAYNSLSNEAKQSVSNLSALEAAEEKVRLYSEVDELKEIIDSLPAVDKLTLTHAETVNKAKALYEDFNSEQKGLMTVAEINFLNKAIDKLDSLAVENAKALIDAIGTVTLESKADIELARAAYDDLTDDQKTKLGTAYEKKLTDAEAKYQELADAASQAEIDAAAARGVEDKINAIGTVTLASKAAIEEARAAYASLTTAQAKLVSDAAVSKLAAAEEAYTKLAVQDTVSKIGAIGTVSLGSEDAIKAARTAYDSLTELQKAKVTNYETLTEAEKSLKELKENKAAADTVIGMIGQIGTVTEDKAAAIAEAREAYDNLTNAQKALVTNYDVLTAAEKALAELTATDADRAAAEAVEKLIGKIGTVTADKADEIAAARKAYDALTDLQKLLVDNADTLVTAESQLKVLETASLEDVYKKTGNYLASAAKQHGLIVGSTGGEWAVIGLERSGVGTPNPELYYSEVVKFVRSEINEKEQLHSAKSTENSRVILALTALGYDVTNVSGHNLLKGLTDMSYVQNQGPNGAIWALIAFDSHDYEIPAGGNVTRDALIRAILDDQFADGGWAMTGSSADADLTGMAIQALAPYYNTNAEVKAAVNKALTTLSKKQNADGSFGSIDGACSESCAQVIVALTSLGIDPETDSRFIKNGISVVDALRTFYVEGGGFRHLRDGELNGMSTEQGYYALAAYFRLLNGQTSLYDMSDVSFENPAETVEALINAIGKVTADSETVIKAARAAYDALSAADKAKVGNYKKLTDAEEKYAEIAEKIAAVEALIDAIGTVKYDKASKEKIDAARKAYNKLSDAEKKYVKNASDLTDAEELYEDLKAAQKVIDLIDAIGEVTEDSEKDIAAARKAYNKLTKAQKALVTNYRKLTEAERELEALNPEGITKVIGDGDTEVIIGNVKYMVDKEAAVVMKDIIKLTDKKNPADEDIIEAYKAYAELSDKLKAQVFNYDDLKAMTNELGVKYHKDEAVGMTIEGDTLEWYIRLVVTEVHDGDTFHVVSGSIAANDLIHLWDIDLINVLTGEKVQPAGMITVRVASSELAGYDDYRILHYSDDGKMEYLDCEVADGYAAWEAGTFSHYALIGGTAKELKTLVEEQEAVNEALEEEAGAVTGALQEEESGSNLLWLWILLGVIGAAAIVLILVLKNKKDKGEKNGF